MKENHGPRCDATMKGPIVILEIARPKGWEILIGEISRPHGVRGEVKVRPRTNLPRRFDKLVGKKVWVEPEGRPAEGRFLKVQRVRPHGDYVLVKFEGVDSIEEAGKLRGHEIYIHRDMREPLSEGEFYVEDLIGAEVVTEEGEVLGKVDKIENLPANDVMVVGDLLIPMIKDVIREVDLERKQIVVRLLEGLR